MPILKSEPDCYPPNLLDELPEDAPWWACYTRSRQEKQLMRALTKTGISHYAPIISRRYRSPAGRVRQSFLPLFSNYVFVCGDEVARHEAVCTGCVSSTIAVSDTGQFLYDLRQIQRLIQTGAPLSPEERLEPGDLVRIRSGQFAGFEGRVVRRHQQTLLIVEVRFMNQGASVALDDCQFDLIEKADQ